MGTPSFNGPDSLDEIDLFTPSMTDLDNPTKRCSFILDKKVRNLEKKKCKLDLYQCKLTQGEELLFEQKEALTKYEATVMNLEFARDIQNQLQILFDQMEKERLEKLNQMQTDFNLIRQVLYIKMISSLVNDFGCIFQNGDINLQIFSKDELVAIEKFFNIITLPSNMNKLNIDIQIDQASSHMLYFLTRSSNFFDDHVTYSSLHDAIDRLEHLGLIENAVQNIGLFAKKMSDKNGVKKLDSQIAIATISATLSASTTIVTASNSDTSTVSVISSASNDKTSFDTCPAQNTASNIETISKSSIITHTCLDVNREISNLDNLDFFSPLLEKSRPVAVISSNETNSQDSFDPVSISTFNEQIINPIDPVCQVERTDASNCDVLKQTPQTPINPYQSAYGYSLNGAYQTFTSSDISPGGVLLPIQSAYPFQYPIYTIPYATTQQIILPDSYLSQNVVGPSSVLKTDACLQTSIKIDCETQTTPDETSNHLAIEPITHHLCKFHLSDPHPHSLLDTSCTPEYECKFRSHQNCKSYVENMGHYHRINRPLEKYSIEHDGEQHGNFEYQNCPQEYLYNAQSVVEATLNPLALEFHCKGYQPQATYNLPRRQISQKPTRLIRYHSSTAFPEKKSNYFLPRSSNQYVKAAYCEYAGYPMEYAEPLEYQSLASCAQYDDNIYGDVNEFNNGAQEYSY